MSRRYYHSYKRRNYHRHSNVLGLSRGEREFFGAISEIIRFIFVFIVEFSKGVYKLSKYIRKIVMNFYALKKIGYSLDELMDFVTNTTPRGFEVLCSELFRQHGYSVQLMSGKNDYGRDIVLNGNIFVECKYYNPKGETNGKMIGREICQKLLGSMQMLGAEKGIIITTGNYHKNAYEVARMVDSLKLMDISDIQKMILDLKPEQIARVIMKTKNAS